MNTKELTVFGLLIGGLYFAHQSGMIPDNSELTNHRAANAQAASFQQADQDAALTRYKNGLCTPYVGAAADQSGLPAGYIRVVSVNLPPDGSPAIDHDGHPFPDGTTLCNKEGQTAVVSEGVISDVKIAGSSPETVRYIEQWFDMNYGRQ